MATGLRRGVIGVQDDDWITQMRCIRGTCWEDSAVGQAEIQSIRRQYLSAMSCIFQAEERSGWCQHGRIDQCPMLGGRSRFHASIRVWTQDARMDKQPITPHRIRQSGVREIAYHEYTLYGECTVCGGDPEWRGIETAYESITGLDRVHMELR